MTFLRKLDKTDLQNRTEQGNFSTRLKVVQNKSRICKKFMHTNGKESVMMNAVVKETKEVRITKQFLRITRRK